MKQRLLWMLVAATVLVTGAFSQSSELQFVVPTSPDVLIRSKPPSGSLLGFAGPVIGITKPDTVYLILGKIELERGFSAETWLRIAPVSKAYGTNRGSTEGEDKHESKLRIDANLLGWASLRKYESWGRYKEPNFEYIEDPFSKINQMSQD